MNQELLSYVEMPVEQGNIYRVFVLSYKIPNEIIMYTYQHFHLKSGYFNFRPCPVGYICLPHVGENPNFGFTSFDNLLWSMLTTFQLITLDYWENVYNMVRNR